MIKSLFQTFVVEMYPIWVGLGFALIYLAIREIISIHKFIKKGLYFDKKLDEIGIERRNILTHVNNYYNELSGRIDKIEKKLQPTSSIK